MRRVCLLLALVCTLHLAVASTALSQAPGRACKAVHHGYAARLGVGGALWQRWKGHAGGGKQPSKGDACGQCCHCQPFFGRIGCAMQVFQCRLCGRLQRAVQHASDSLHSTFAGCSKGCANCPSACNTCAMPVPGNYLPHTPSPSRPTQPVPAPPQRSLPPDPFVDDPQVRLHSSSPTMMLRTARANRLFGEKTVTFRISDQ